MVSGRPCHGPAGDLGDLLPPLVLAPLLVAAGTLVGFGARCAGGLAIGVVFGAVLFASGMARLRRDPPRIADHDREIPYSSYSCAGPYGRNTCGMAVAVRLRPNDSQRPCDGPVGVAGGAQRGDDLPTLRRVEMATVRVQRDRDLAGHGGPSVTAMRRRGGC